MEPTATPKPAIDQAALLALRKKPTALMVARNERDHYRAKADFFALYLQGLANGKKPAGTASEADREGYTITARAFCRHEGVWVLVMGTDRDGTTSNVEVLGPDDLDRVRAMRDLSPSDPAWHDAILRAVGEARATENRIGSGTDTEAFRLLCSFRGPFPGA
mgnify:CR=1 FL=1